MPNADHTPIPDHVFQDAADTIVATEQSRRVPTMAERVGCGHTPEQHRHTDGQDADAASRDRAIRELTAERDRARAVVREAYGQLGQARGDRNRLARDLGAAGDVLAVVRDATEQIDRALARYDTAPEVTRVEPDEPEATDLEDALEHAESALIDRDDSVWRPGDLGFWTTRYLEPMTRDDIEQVYGPTRAVLLIDIDQDDEPDDEAEAPLGSVSPHAQDDTTRLLVAIEWHGDYYQPSERVDMAREWIESALLDRDDSPSVTITDLAKAPGEHADEQSARDRVERAIRTRLAATWPPLADPGQNNWLDQVAAVAAVAAVNALRQG